MKPFELEPTGSPAESQAPYLSKEHTEGFQFIYNRVHDMYLHYSIESKAYILKQGTYGACVFKPSDASEMISLLSSKTSLEYEAVPVHAALERPKIIVE